MAKFKQFYLSFPILATVSRLSWSQMVVLLPIQDQNKRNYYINQCIDRNLSVRSLRNEIKNQNYERLIEKPQKIEIVSISKNQSILSNMKNPILIELEKGKTIKNEHDLETTILAKLQYFFSQLGEGFTLVGNQYKVSDGNKNYYADILLFNYKFNCFFVVELKLRELRKEDKAQV